MQLHVSTVREQANNNYYPRTIPIKSLDDLKQAARYDHIAGLMKDNRRSKGNFVSADCIMVDLDNTHSEDPGDWQTLDDIADAFPDVAFYVIRSRNYMKEKKKTQKDGSVIVYQPRPKYHVYFPLSETVTGERYETVMTKVFKLFPFFDPAARDVAHFFYGVEYPKGEEVDGDLTIDFYLDSIGNVQAERIYRDYCKDFPQLAGKKTDAPVADPAGQQTDTNWIALAERDRSVTWFREFASVFDIEIIREYELNENDRTHPKAFVFCVSCPWEEEHSGGDWPDNESVVIVDLGGKLSFLCRHSHGERYGWKDYRAYYEDKSGASLEAFRQSHQNKTKQETSGAAPKDSQEEEAKDADWKIFKGYYDSNNRGKTLPDSAAQFISSGAWKRNSDIFAKYGNRKTGFENLDEQIGSFYPGVYLLNAGTSMGKTTFSVQLADQFAKNGETILYYAFEQSAFDLVAKSIAREYFYQFFNRDIELHKEMSGEDQDPAEYMWTCAERVNRDAISCYRTTATGIKKGEGLVSREFEEWVKDPERNSSGFFLYQKYSDRIHYVNCAFGWTIDDVIESIINFIEETRMAPIVFIDYLQVIKPADDHISDIKAIDYAVQAIRKLAMVSQEKGYPVTFVVISSVSRAQYTAEADISAGKGSGGLEFTADVVWSLQPRVMMTAQYRKAKEQTKRRLVKKAKHPKDGKAREVVLEATKNRYGLPDYAVGFNYYPAVETFLPDPKFPDWLLEQQQKEAEAAKRAEALAEAKEKKELDQIQAVDPEGFLDIVGTAQKAAEKAVEEAITFGDGTISDFIERVKQSE